MVNRKEIPPPPTPKRRSFVNLLETSISTSSSLNTASYSSISSKMSTRQSYVFLGLTLIITIIAAPVHSVPVVSKTTKAATYLSQFGYLPASTRIGGLLDANTWNKAVQEFQSFAGLNATGELDDETMQLMSLPRCGVRDKVGFGNDNRSKRYTVQGSRWHEKALTYKISKYPKRLNRPDVDAEIARAFALWSEHIDLTFTPKTTGPVDIEIKFVKSEHGDGFAFDGDGGTLAHAFFPEFGGDAHFDDAELWTIGSFSGQNLVQAAAHEFGHSLGLYHSDVRSSCMTPFSRDFEPDFQLDSDDVLAIQSIYGKKSSDDRRCKPIKINTNNLLCSITISISEGCPVAVLDCDVEKK